ncbi:MAG: hypothetical protein R2991_10690 [Thermoanaerobaculia bacterium]
MPRLAFGALALLLVGCAGPTDEHDPMPTSPQEEAATSLDDVAAEYVRLVLALGEHDDGYVDAYYGPAEWREELRTDTPPLEAILERATAARRSLPRGGDGDTSLRVGFLDHQLAALETRVHMLQGETYTFDEESERLYGAVAPTLSEESFAGRIEELGGMLPGTGDVLPRLEAFRERFTIPPDRLDAVFQAALTECRKRTGAHLTLPPGERFRIEYVTDKPWSGYNWYQGGFESLIQVNTELPIRLERAVDLACHEGYPGHHTYNALREWELVDGKGWIEHTVYPLYSPLSLIAEGSANYGIDLAFPGEERARFEAETLAPLAGIDPGAVPEYYRVLDLLDHLSFAGNEAARRYLDGEIDASAAAEWLQRYALYAPDRAAQRVRFIDTYRSYVINYNLGKQIVREWVERGDASSDERWQRFGDLLSSPRLPSDLLADLAP